MTRPFSRVIDAVAAIAEKLGATVVNKGDRLADNLEAIVEVVDSGGGGGGSIFAVKFSADGEDNITADKTFAQTYEAAQSGAFVYGQDAYVGFLYLGMVESSTLVFYSPATASAEGVHSDRYVWLPDDTINWYADDYPSGS